MDNNKIKRAELGDDEIKSVSGGCWASDIDERFARSTLEHIEHNNGRYTYLQADEIFREMAEDGNSYTYTDFRNRIEEKLGHVF